MEVWLEKKKLKTKERQFTRHYVKEMKRKYGLKHIADFKKTVNSQMSNNNHFFKYAFKNANFLS